MSVLINIDNTAFFTGMFLSLVLLAGIIVFAVKKAETLTTK